MKEFNGHRSWNSWNVSLWVNNDYNLYMHAVELVREYGRDKAARRIARMYAGERTPDGARFNRLSIWLALEGIE